MLRRRAWLAVALVVGVCAAACTPTWLTYHRDNSRTGADASGPATPVGVAWTSAFLDQFPYTEPVVYENRVYVATENNTVYALDLGTGNLVWSRHLVQPFTQVVTQCMYDVNPVGITGTPVIDPSTNILYVVVETGPTAGHALVGLDTATGDGRVLASGDPAGANTSTLWNRTALTLGNGRLYWGYLGADCNSYQGTMVSVKTDGSSPVYYQIPGFRGSFWAPSGAAIDADGNVWAASGSGGQVDPTKPDRTTSLLEFSPTLQLLAYFTPSNWTTLNSTGQELGSAGPSLLPNGVAFIAGKNKEAFLVSEATPGGVSNGVASFNTNCRSFGGDSTNGDIVYMPCEDGMLALSVSGSPPTLTQLWKGPSDSNGPPVYGGSAVWVMSVDTGILYALNPSNGAPLQSIQLVAGEKARHFTTPTVAGDTVLVATEHHVVAVRHVSG
ncbi:MAG: PQQ-binding-like beta-propeller repeat protein [Actinobacteria bacterium]|nr:PQQ-binding-like beta-propeller repeat protein [Actinomycetota bacterium]